MNTFSIQNFMKRGDTIVLTLRPDASAGGQGRQWREDDTSLLLSLMEKFAIDFNEKVKKKNHIWMEIAENLNSHGFPWSSNDCRKKWSNILRTFKAAYDAKNDATNFKPSRWIFYDRVSEILMSQIGIYLPETSTLLTAMSTFSPSIQTELITGETSAFTSDLANDDISQGVNGDQIAASTILLHQSVVEEDDVTHQLMTSEGMVGEYGTNIEVITMGHESVPDSEGRLIEIHNIDVNSFHAQDELLSCVISEEQLSSTASSFILPTDGIPHFVHDPVKAQSVPGLVPDTRISVARVSKAENKKDPMIPGRRQRQKREWKTAFPEGNDDEPLVSRLISVTMEHNEKVLAEMKQFHEEALGVMRERNKTLSDLCEFLKRS